MVIHKKNKKMASVTQKKTEEREYITCFIKILPPMVTSKEAFIKYIGRNIFPIEILPIRLNKYGKIVMKDDGSYVIEETPDTIQFGEFKSFQFRQGDHTKTKFTLTFKVPIPRESDIFYDYMMDNLVNPLLHPTDEGRDATDEDESEKTPIAKLSWDFHGRESYVLISLYENTSDIPPQSRFHRCSVKGH